MKEGLPLQDFYGTQKPPRLPRAVVTACRYLRRRRTQKLRELLDEGVLTQEGFEVQKKLLEQGYLCFWHSNWEVGLGACATLRDGVVILKASAPCKIRYSPSD